MSFKAKLFIGDYNWDILNLRVIKVVDKKEEKKLNELNFTNFMAYDVRGGSDFFKWQWDAMQKDIISFYS